MGSDFYKLTIFARLDVELRHGAPFPTITAQALGSDHGKILIRQYKSAK
jgi:hypothetical protein